MALLLQLRMNEGVELVKAKQEISSAGTSINSSKLPMVFKKINFTKDTINLDFGGGRFDNVAEYLKGFGAVNLVYDPYNRTDTHNKAVLETIEKNNGADSITCSNVLNVVKEDEAREAIIKNCYKLLKSGCKAYFTVYEGNGTNVGAPSSKGFQLNRKTADYVEEISKVFGSVTVKSKIIIAKK